MGLGLDAARSHGLDDPERAEAPPLLRDYASTASFKAGSK
jgi:hypothetical protein